MRDPEQPPNPSTYVIHLKQMGTFYDVPGEYGYVLEGGNHGFEALSFILTETHPGAGPPLHVHGCEEAHVLLEGSARYIIGKRTFSASVRLHRSMLPSPHEGRLGLWGFRFEAISAFTFVTAR